MSDGNTMSTYPALLKLEDDQRRCVETFREGFENEDDALEWSLELMAVSFGYISNELLTALHSETTIRLSMVPALKGKRNPGKKFPQEARRHVRHQIEEMRLNPAFRRAYRDLRNSANEYVDPEKRPSPSEIAKDTPREEDSLPVALRPSLQGLHDRQKEVLRDLLAGFDSKVEIVDWARSLTAASHGEVPQDMIDRLTTAETTLRLWFLGHPSPEEAKMVRYKYASQVVLPAFNDGIRTLTGAAGERTANEEDSGDGLAQELGA
jgi:hypothetical protein